MDKQEPEECHSDTFSSLWHLVYGKGAEPNFCVTLVFKGQAIQN